MNLNDVYTALKTVIEATARHPSASHHDTFCVAEDVNPQSPVRTVGLEEVTPGQPAEAWTAGTGMGADPIVVDWQMEVLYGAQDQTIWRYEIPLLIKSIMDLPHSSVNQTTYSGQIRTVSMTAESIIGAAEADVESDSFRVFLWRITTVFDSRDPS